MVQCAERLGMMDEASRYQQDLNKATRDAQRMQYDQQANQHSPVSDSMGGFEQDMNQGFAVKHEHAAPMVSGYMMNLSLSLLPMQDIGDVSVAQKAKGKTVAQLNTVKVDDDDWGDDELGDDLLPDT